MKKVFRYAAVAGAAALLALAAALTDESVTPAEWVSVAVAACGALGLYGKQPPSS